MLNDDEVKKSIGAKLKARRRSLKLTQNEVAEAVDMDEKQLSRLEAGKHYPTLKTLLSLINFLGMNLSDFDKPQKVRDRNFYEILDILNSSTPNELKQYLIILNAVKNISK